jgi:hypothetical protein
MIHHEGILSLAGVLMNEGEGMVADLVIRNLTIRFNKVLG